MRTVFLGTGKFAVPIVTALAEDPRVDLVAVVTAPQRAGSRGKPTDPPVATWSEARGLPMLRPNSLRAPESLDAIRELEPDLLVLADYGQIVPAALLQMARHGALNLHPSLLPRHRGATPIPAAILAGDAQTGVTLMLMDAGLDTGRVIAQSRMALTGHETASELEETLAAEAARLLSSTLDQWLAGDISEEPQNAAKATSTRPLRRSDGRIDPHRSAADIERQVRAYQPWPGSFLEIAGNRVVVWRAHRIGAPGQDIEVGALYRADQDGLALRTADGGLTLDEVQPAGGRIMSGAELARGRPALIGGKVDTPADPDT